MSVLSLMLFNFWFLWNRTSKSTPPARKPSHPNSNINLLLGHIFPSNPQRTNRISQIKFQRFLYPIVLEIESFDLGGIQKNDKNCTRCRYFCDSNCNWICYRFVLVDLSGRKRMRKFPSFLFSGMEFFSCSCWYWYWKKKEPHGG